MLSRSLVGFTVLTFSAAACSRSESAPPQGPVNAAVYAQAVCNHYVRCAPAFVREHFTTTTECTQRYEAEALRRFSLQGVKASRAEVNACAVEIDKAGCDVDVEALAACDFKGELPDGQRCTTGAQCSSGSCFRANAGGCGSCSVRATDGESCSATACAPGLVCVRDVCQPRVLSRGRARGEPCDPVNAPCNGAQSLVCEGGRCEEKASIVNTSCAAVPFCEQSFCDAKNTKLCKPHVAEGGACASSLECAFPLQCIGDVCLPATSCP